MREMLNTEPGKLSIKQDLLVDKAQDLLKTLLVAEVDEATDDEVSGDKASADEPKATESPADEVEAEEAVAEDKSDVEGIAEPVEKQDLTKIEGIGPKTAGLLNEAGIVAYSQLADTELEQLRAILEAAGSRYRIMKPDTWPQQARLAAETKWDELKALQDNISGGVLIEHD
jgi:predicted flap endonuclease-1-like 5' DNA nuclease